MERRIYVACLASYNAGILHGVWIDVSADIEESVAAMLTTSSQPGAEEYAIHDYEGFGPWKMSESQSFESIAEFNAVCEEVGEDVFFAALENFNDVDEAAKAAREDYCGQYDSVEDYAFEYLKDTGLLLGAGLLEQYFDYKAFARDLVLGGDIWVSEAGHVFNNS